MKRKALSWLVVILWMSLIFYLSHQPVSKSNKLSKEITGKISEIVEQVEPNRKINLGKTNHIIRKNAHFFAYLILGVLVSNGLRSSGVIGYRVMNIALLICILFAISDEIHQLFVPGRGGQVKDVIIDSAGSIVGIVGYGLTVARKHL